MATPLSITPKNIFTLFMRMMSAPALLRQEDFVFLKLLLIVSIRIPLKVVIIFKHRIGIEGQEEVTDVDITEFVNEVEFNEILLCSSTFSSGEVRPETSLRHRDHTAIWAQALEYVRFRNLKCKTWKTADIPFRQLSAFARAIQFQRFEDASLIHEFNGITGLLAVRRCSEFKIFSSMPPNDFLSSIRHFRKIAIFTHKQTFIREFAGFIEDCRFMESGRLRKVFVRMGPFLGVSVINTWPGTVLLWNGITHQSLPAMGQLHMVLPDHTDKLIFILTKEQSPHTDQLVYFLDPEDIENLVSKVIMMVCPQRPVDGSLLFEEIRRMEQEDLPHILRNHLSLITV